MNFTDILPYSYNGTSNRLNYTNYKTKMVLSNSVLAESTAVEIERAEDYPVYSGMKLSSREVLLQIEVLSTGSGSIGELQGWFDTSLGQAEYRVYDTAGSAYWEVSAKPLAMNLVAQNAALVRLYVDNPVWERTTIQTTSWTVTSSGGTVVINNPGSYYALPVITINPQSARVGYGYGYKRWVAMYNRTSNAAVNYSVNVLGTTLNHAALVSGGKAQADGDDFRVTRSGRHLYRWVGGGGWNSTTLKVFSNFNFSPGISVMTAADIAATGAISTVTVTASGANYKKLTELGEKATKIFMIGNEAFTYTGTTPALSRIDGVVRAQRGTAEEAHTAGDLLWWVEHDVFVIYGNSAATAAAAAILSPDGVNKPMLDLVNSTNSIPAWTEFHDRTYPNRPMSWKYSVKSIGNTRGGTTAIYRADHGANAGTASEMGMKMSEYNWNGINQTENAEIRWEIDLPIAGGTAASYTGEKYTNVTGAYPALAAGLQVQEVEGTWVNVYKETAPGTAGTWGAFTRTGLTFGDTYDHVGFALQGNVLGTTAGTSIRMIEIDNVSINLNTGQTLSVTLGAEDSAYYAEVTLENLTTSQGLTFEYPSAVGLEIEVDCKNQTVEDEDGTRLVSAIEKDSRRIEWMRLAPGDNTLKYTELGVADVDLTVSIYPRSL